MFQMIHKNMNSVEDLIVWKEKISQLLLVKIVALREEYKIKRNKNSMEDF